MIRGQGEGKISAIFALFAGGNQNTDRDVPQIYIYTD
jgi:hypothetical protein